VIAILKTIFTRGQIRRPVDAQEAYAILKFRAEHGA